MSSGILKRISQIDDKTKIIVNRFITDSQNLLPYENNSYYNICDLIIHLCTLYYYVNEYWDILSVKCKTLSEDKRVLIKSNSDDWSHTNYAHQTVPSKGDLTYQWYLKMNKLKSGCAFVGIVDSDFITTKSAARYSTNIINYFYYGFNGNMTYKMFNLERTGLPYENDDLILVELDTKNGKLTFYKGSSIKDIAVSGGFDVVQRDNLSYKLATTLFYKNDYITIVDLRTI